MMGVTFAPSARWSRWPTRCRASTARARSSARIIGAGIIVDPDRAVDEPDAALLPAGGHRHDHRDHRHQPDARRHRLGDGRPAHLAQSVDVPKLVAMVDGAKATAAAASASGAAAAPCRLGPIPMLDNPNYAALDNLAIAALRAGRHPADLALRARLRRQHRRCCSASSPAASSPSAIGKMTFDKVAQGALVRRRHAVRLRHADLRSVMILTMTLVMIVVMIESTGMFLALSDITGKQIDAARSRRGPAHRRPRHADRRHLQHLPVHQLLAERRPGRRDRRQEPLRLRGRRRDHGRARPAAEDGARWSSRCRSSCSAAPAW